MWRVPRSASEAMLGYYVHSLGSPHGSFQWGPSRNPLPGHAEMGRQQKKQKNAGIQIFALALPPKPPTVPVFLSLPTCPFTQITVSSCPLGWVHPLALLFSDSTCLTPSLSVFQRPAQVPPPLGSPPETTLLLQTPITYVGVTQVTIIYFLVLLKYLFHQHTAFVSIHG